MSKATLALIVSGNAKKGDVLGTAGRRHHGRETDFELIPLCHPLLCRKSRWTSCRQKPPRLHCARCGEGHRPTGVEMEALTAVSVACLTIYDMIKRSSAASASKAFT